MVYSMIYTMIIWKYLFDKCIEYTGNQELYNWYFEGQYFMVQHIMVQHIKNWNQNSNEEEK